MKMTILSVGMLATLLLLACDVGGSPEGIPGLSPRAASGAAGQTDSVSFAFWNLENLFDTSDDPANPGDDEFLPQTGWDPARYQRKLRHLAEVIAELDPHLIGFAEVENRAVLEDLIEQDSLRQRGFHIAHRDSPDKRGIDLALLYRKPFSLAGGDEGVILHPIAIDPPTRGILEVPLEAGGSLLTVLVNHWPSRRGGTEATLALRRTAAELCRRIILARIDAASTKGAPDADILVIGDFNDDPFDRSVRGVLGAVRSRNAVLNDRQGGRYRLYNPCWRFLGQADVGTYYYNRGWTWNVFDQCIVSRGLLRDEGFRFDEESLAIHAPDSLRDRYRRPRWFRKRRGSEEWHEGYSDHFAIHGKLRYRGREGP